MQYFKVDVIDVTCDMFCCFLIKIRINSTSLVTFSRSECFASKLFFMQPCDVMRGIGCRLNPSCRDASYNRLQYVTASNDDTKIKLDIA